MIVSPFAREVKRLRAARGFTVRDLAAALGKSVAYIAKIEVQGEVPSPELICEMAGILDASPAEMLRTAKAARLMYLEREIDRQHAAALLADERIRTSGASRTANNQGDRRMATVLSMINMKGGVGKTTFAMHLAHAADVRDLRTLAVDLDPQSNLSQALMGLPAYVKYLEEEKPTIFHVFDEYIPRGTSREDPRLLDTHDVIVKKAGYWSDSTLDLIPSRLELSRTLKNPAGKERRLARALAQVEKDYDLIIVDCAPTESVLTEAAYFASRYVLVPIKPEYMATIGLPLLARSLQDFRLENPEESVEIAGLAFNHSSSYSSGPEGQQAIKDVTRVAKEHGWRICDNQVKYSASYSKSAREGAPLSQTSYARGNVAKNFNLLASEIFELIGVAEVPA